jgi:hypothetical protein
MWRTSSPEGRWQNLYEMIKHRLVLSFQEVVICFFNFVGFMRTHNCRSTFSTIHSSIAAAISSVYESETTSKAAAATSKAVTATKAAATTTTTTTVASSAAAATAVDELSPTIEFRATDEIAQPTTAFRGKTSRPASVMSGSSSVLSAQQLKDAEFAVKKVKDSQGVWPFAGSWYYPTSGPKLNESSSRDPDKYFSIPVLLFMPVQEFSNRFDKCPCAFYGYKHKRVISNGYTEPCRVVGSNFTYAMVGNRY